MMEKFSTALETKEFSEGHDHYVLEGYASVFDNVDQGNDVVVKGAFAKSLRDRRPVLLYGHDMESIPIGRIDEVYEDQKGLFFKAHLPKDDAMVRDRIAPQLRCKSLTGVSFGYQVKQKEHRKDGIRLLKELAVHEISLVSIPMNASANVESFKHLGAIPYADLPMAERDRPWDKKAAYARVMEFTGSNENEIRGEFESAFLYCEPDASDDLSSYKFMVCDVIGDRLTLVPRALYKAATELMRMKSGDISSPARDALQENLDRYYARLELQSATKALSKSEWNALEADECEARLRSLGLSGGLAKALSSGQRDVGRNPRDAGLEELRKSLSAIQTLVEGQSSNV